MSKKTAAAAVKDQPALFGEDRGPEAVAGAVAASKATKTKAKRPEIGGDPMKPKQAVATISPANPRNMLAVILQASSDPKVDVAKMQALLAMQKEMVAEQSRLDFIQAFFEMKRELPRINKDGRIEILEKGTDGKRVAGRDRVQQATPYATYENIREVVDPILHRFGFTMWDETEPSPDGTRIHVITHIDHNNGHGRRSVFPLPAEASGSKNNVQGWGSSNSYGKRYGCLNLLNLRTKAPEDRDTDGNRPKLTKGGKPQTTDDGGVVVEGGVAAVELCSEEQIAKVREAIEGCGVSEKTFCQHFGIAKVSALPLASLADALEACRRYEEKHK